MPAAWAQNSTARAGVSLKLDWDLVPRIGTPGVRRAQLLNGQGPELRGRILKVRDQVAALEQSNAEKAAYLNRHEELIQRMRGVVQAQEKVIARLAAEAKRPQQVAMVQPRVPAPRPAPRPQVATTMPPIHLGPIELPGEVRNYLMEGAFGLIVVILLSWALYLRSVARARTAELTILKGGSTAMPTPAPEEASEAFDEWSEPEPEPEPVPLSALEPEPAPKPKAVPPPAALTRARRTDSDTAPEQEWSETLVQQKATDPEALTEVDNLIATGDLTKARQLLTELTKGNKDNPEYHVRLLHVESALGDSSKASEQEQILAKMSEGVLSDTRSRIKEIGRGLLPGHPLFDDDKKREEARRIMEFHGSD
ncbi:MAG: hypothetical protein R3337_14420, partial [Gammaproteobacteria bacterium]|nr:hypothetical protein [Gammaproteobacteria bacterium]